MRLIDNITITAAGTYPSATGFECKGTRLMAVATGVAGGSTFQLQMSGDSGVTWATLDGAIIIGTVLINPFLATSQSKPPHVRLLVGAGVPAVQFSLFDDRDGAH